MITELHCPWCGEEDTLVIVPGTAGVKCTHCDAEATPEELREQAKGLERLAAWCEACPTEKQA